MSPPARWEIIPTLVRGDAVLVDDFFEPKPRHVERYAALGGRNPRPARLVLAANEQFGRNIDISWLPFAAEEYEISADPRDHVIVPIPIVTCDVPNRNMDCFPFEEASKWNYLQGSLTYKTFVGKPTCKDHDNQDPRRARGIHYDASLRRWKKNPNYWKIRVLAAFDRSKDEQMVRDILDHKRTAYSMGGLVDRTICSVCGEVTSGKKKCTCMEKRGKGGVHHGHLVYDICHGINWIESSSLGKDPADVYAYEETVF